MAPATVGLPEGVYEFFQHRPVLNCAMDKTAIERDLARVEHHVRQGEQIIARQRDIITGLERGGHDTAQAKTLLGQLEETQALHVGHRERLRRQLVDFDPFNVREVREPTSWKHLSAWSMSCPLLSSKVSRP